MTKSNNRGQELFNSGYYCAESVLMVIAEEENISSDVIPAIASGLCGGMSGTCNMCGAVTGGILALSLVHGRKSPADSADLNYKTVQELITRFTDEYGSSNCQELLGLNLGTVEGQEKFKSEQLDVKCSEYTGKAAEFTRTIIDKYKIL